MARPIVLLLVQCGEQRDSVSYNPHVLPTRFGNVVGSSELQSYFRNEAAPLLRQLAVLLEQSPDQSQGTARSLLPGTFASDWTGVEGVLHGSYCANHGLVFTG